MKKKASHSSSAHLTAARSAAPVPPGRSALATGELSRCLRAWVQEGVYRQLSERTNGTRKYILGKLIWFLETNDLEQCGDAELRDFFVYLTTGHDEKGGRWGLSAARPDLAPSLHRAPRSRTTMTYHAYIPAFFAWCVEQGMLDQTPMQRIKPPPVPKDQVDPFTPSQIDAFIVAAKAGPFPQRDAAIVWLLYDTGLRAEGMCRLRLSDVDLLEKRLSVVGKGNKARSVSFGLTVSRALWAYLRDGRRDPTSLATQAPASAKGLMRTPLFLPRCGQGADGGQGLTPSASGS